MYRETGSRKERKKIVGRTLVIFLVVLLLLTFFSNTLNNFLSPKVSVQRPESGQIVKEISSTGKVRAKKIMDTYVQTQMQVLKLSVKVGDKVKKGQLLMELDTSAIEEQLINERLVLQQKKLNLEKLGLSSTEINISSYENAIETAKINMEKAKKKYEDMDTLYEIGAEAAVNVSDAKMDYEKTKLELKKAQMDYQLALNGQKEKEKSSKADLENAVLEFTIQEKKVEKLGKQLEMGRIVAPGNGIIIELNFETGTMADSSKPLYKLADTSKGFEFIATIDSEATKKLNSGDLAEISIDSMEGYSIEGTINRIIYNRDNIGTKKDVILDIPPDNLSGGENGSVTIKKNSKIYDFLVSNAALGQDNTGYFVYVLKEQKGPLGNGYVTQKVNVLTAESDNWKTGITSGLNSSDQIITASDKQLSEGMKVTLLQ